MIVVEPTCYSQGEKAYLCQDCGMYTGEFFINGLTHNYVELTSEYVAPTCTTDGKRVYECTLCKDRHWDYVSPLDHVFTDKTVVQSADCNQIGIETEICSRCNETTRKEIPKTIHDYETMVIRESTCYSTGEIKYVCKNCGQSTTAYTNKISHSYVDYSITKDETIRTLWNSVIYKASATYINTSSYEATDHLGYVGINYNTNANALDYTTLSE